MSFFTAADCEIGHFLNSSNECQACDIGYYQDEEWRDRVDTTAEGNRPFLTGCKKCRSGTSTDGTGHDSMDDCSSMFPKR